MLAGGIGTGPGVTGVAMRLDVETAGITVSMWWAPGISVYFLQSHAGGRRGRGGLLADGRVAVDVDCCASPRI